jgi:hypothetical protein
MRAVIRRQQGTALPIAMMVLAAVGTLSAMVALSSVQSSTSSKRDRGAKAALAAANAGVQAGIYRLTHAGALSANCFTTVQVPPGADGVCPGQSESLGNGASYTYYISPVLGPAGGCTGLYVQGPSGQPAIQRCVTGTGTAIGVTRRVQERVAAYRYTSPFPLNGILSLGDAKATGTFNFSGDFEGNGKIELPSGGSLNGATIHYVPGGSATAPTCGTGCTIVQEPSPYTVPPVDPALYAASASSSGNDNAAISWQPPAAYDPATRRVNYSGQVGSAGSPVVIPSGTYNFCEVKFSNKTYIALAPGAQVKIYIDSPYRSGSGCPAGTGEISFSNATQINNPSHDPGALQFFVYGDPADPKQTPVKITNTISGEPDVPLYAQIYAPNSAFSTTNVLTMVGGIVAATYTSSNTVNFSGAQGGASNDGAAVPYYVAAWHECPHSPSGADPGSGCY